MKLYLAILMLVFSSLAFSKATVTTSNVLYSPDSSDGYSVGQSATSKIGFYGVTPVVQPTDASQSAFTDGTGGTASDSLAGDMGVTTIVLPIQLSNITANGDVVTSFSPGYKFKILGFQFLTNEVVSTGSKAATVNLEIDTNNLVGGVLSLASSGLATLGAITDATAITASNTGTSAQGISIEATAVTAFAEGGGAFLIRIQNMEIADAWAAMADKWNQIRSDMVDLGLIKGE